MIVSDRWRIRTAKPLFIGSIPIAAFFFPKVYLKHFLTLLQSPKYEW